ncbi:cytochrome P450 3A56-like [Amphiura filiformis]|uniref:cytochrome P450 3A56-like n=1 Tax=Amphiura filiformis TaxID=82378 RepID=UPI003B218FC3
MEENDTNLSTTWMLVYTAIALFIINQIYNLTHFWRRGIKGPMPFPFIGNYPSFAAGFVPTLEKWEKKYGQVYGIFVGRQPVLMISDADLAKQILVKQFSSFYSTKESEFKIRYLSDSLQALEGDAWKRTRSYVSPAFSTSKMKQMIPAINTCCDRMLTIMQKKIDNQESFETKPVFGSYVLDVIASCAFGINTDCQTNPDEPFLKHTKQLFSIKLTNPAFLIMIFAPFMAPIFNLFDVSFLPDDSLEFFANIARKSVQLRKEGGAADHKDLLQLMLDAAETGGSEEEEVTETRRTPGEVKSKRKKIPLTHKDIISQSLIFFFAGYETVSTTLSFVAYAIATHPQVQEKLQEEIDKILKDDEPVSYEMISKMEYLDKVWCEAMRRYTSPTVIKRRCTDDFNHNGVRISKGQMVYIDKHAIHRNPLYWPNPLDFDPERFSREAKETHHPCANLAFGAGPRNCVGMRFAILEAKFGLVRILQRYKLEVASETDDLSDTSNWGKSTVYPAKGIHLKASPRT